MGKINDNLHVGGLLSADSMTVPASTITNAMVNANADIVRTKLAQESLATYPVDLNACRVHDDGGLLLPTTAATDDLAIDEGAIGTNAPRLRTGDLKAAGATTRYARLMIPIPVEYEDAETVEIRISGGMLTTVADTSAVVDLQVYELDRDGGVSADINATAAQSINSVTFADVDFTVTATGLIAGSMLDVRVAITVTDAATGTVVEGAIGIIELRCDIRG